MAHRIVSLVSALSGVVMLGACANAPTKSTRNDPPPPPPAAAPTALTAAHAAYLDGDFIALGERIRDVLLDPASSELVKANAYELLDKSYEVTNGKLPSTFKLPEGYLNVHYGSVRSNIKYGGPSSLIYLRGRARDASHLKNVTLRRLPNQLLLDRASGKGSFDIRKDEPGYQDFVIEVKAIDALPADGVFTVRLELDDGTVSEGWFLGRGLQSSASPEVTSPTHAASLSDPNPVVTWVPFRSPEYMAFEQRTFNVWMGQEHHEDLAWNFWTGEPGDLSSVRAGQQADAPATKLAPGDYWMAVTAGELRHFGPVILERGSRTVLPFHVVK